ncbi:MAG: benzoyl-CoA reductase, bzd-type, subunit O [Chloroflexi bacterium]|nr:benzoyl-CoA reductase, bzd-type, subunit O [Chloroflexota bacterium]
MQNLYKTRPLKMWQKAKELRLKFFKDIQTAKENGKTLVLVDSGSFIELPAGLEGHACLEGHPYGATVGMDLDFARECAEEVEARGYARDLCVYTRNFWGSMFRNRYYFGGEFPRPDFCIKRSLCDTESKWLQVCCEHFNMPSFYIDFPLYPDRRTGKEDIEYLATQMSDCIEWMEKITGQKYNDDKFIHAAHNEFRTTSLWAEICTLNKAIPAPLDQKTIYTLYFPTVVSRYEDDTVHFYEELLAEVKDRVSDHIAALATERCRLWDDGIPPWYFLKLYRYLERYGAVVLGSIYTYTLHGAWEDQPDDSWGRATTPEERGMPLKTRDDALRALALWYLEKPIYPGMCLPGPKSEQLLRIIREWRIDGMMMHMNRGCEGLSLGAMEQRLALLKAGVPVTVYEGNSADKREFDENQVLDRLDAFMESLGMKKLDS